jgi:hypothetical protein
MLKSEECRRFAQECRSLASQTGIGDRRNILLKMAETWEMLANKAAIDEVAGKTTGNAAIAREEPPEQG